MFSDIKDILLYVFREYEWLFMAISAMTMIILIVVIFWEKIADFIYRRKNGRLSSEVERHVMRSADLGLTFDEDLLLTERDEKYLNSIRLKFLREYEEQRIKERRAASLGLDYHMIRLNPMNKRLVSLLAKGDSRMAAVVARRLNSESKTKRGQLIIKD
jgi:hypothetical protein